MMRERRTRSIGLVFALFAVMSCDANRGADAGPDATVSCAPSGSDPRVFPMFDRTCTQDTDCFAAIHQSDCCGTLVAIGVSETAYDAFRRAESTCRGMYPECGCHATGLFAEDGVRISSQLDPSIAHAECVDGTCRVRVRDVPCGDSLCAPEQVCVHPCGVARDAGDPDGGHCVDVPLACARSSLQCTCLGSDVCASGCLGVVQSQVECACP